MVIDFTLILFPYSVGVVTAIPLSVVVDFVIHRKTAYFLVYVGMGFIALGFAGFCVSEFIAARKESKEELENVSLQHNYY